MSGRNVLKAGRATERTPSIVGSQVVDREYVVGDGAATHQMLGDDAVQNLSRHRVVPDPIGIHHGDGTLLAHAKA